MSDTPRVDAILNEILGPGNYRGTLADFARQLERELAAKSAPASASDRKEVKLTEVICWAQIRQCALEEIRAKFPDTEAAKIAGRAMTMGPDSKGMANLANRATESPTPASASVEEIINNALDAIYQSQDRGMGSHMPNIYKPAIERAIRSAIQSAIAPLHQRLATAEADTKRLDWLEEMCRKTFCVLIRLSQIEREIRITPNKGKDIRVARLDFREAIDAAQAKENNG